MQGAGNLTDFSIYRGDTLYSACHKIVWTASFTLLQENRQADCIILPDDDEETIGSLFDLIYMEKHRSVDMILKISFPILLPLLQRGREIQTLPFEKYEKMVLGNPTTRLSPKYTIETGNKYHFAN